MSFPNKLKKLREDKKLTQEELSKLVGVSLKTISRYEKGESKPRYRKIYDKLAEVLDTSHDYLVTDEEDFILDARDKYGYKGAIDAKKMVDGVIGLMAGGEIDESDKKAILDSIQEAYYIAKSKNKKYGQKKTR
ncbi:helix-turn-helix transcriptional regulator [Anaerococcus sp. AGMB00486]|uniref:Helix-turn-helix transcriptional regulator n=2 Tax=Anaerococcus TaxID=165779 RepID=A0ABX2N9R2_9FIRM|nr:MULTISPECIES: helix-turn-helix transcriptional regulator [Anaerococcus]MDY3006814.1 helix-turn-helix transcriptional regulator [Anaerococcus porci]MSS78269.1 helix-turn-helix transcriptional regulator [Anaerococcus porci]NVF11383.1 helix-turn-helix transcriptional regulator [Anaerococcus faecalis]